jgi:hypothetical protein
MSDEQKGMVKPIKQTSYTIKVANPDGGDFTYVIKPLSIDVYYAMMKLIRNSKTFDAYVMMIGTLKIEGDDPQILLSDARFLPCLMALDEILAEMIQPATASIKKN